MMILLSITLEEQLHTPSLIFELYLVSIRGFASLSLFSSIFSSLSVFHDYF